MGQNPSKKDLSVESLQDEIARHARLVKEIATLNFQDLENYVKDINQLAKKCMDADGKQLLFNVVGNNDGFFWKSNVKVVCVKFTPDDTSRDRPFDDYRIMPLNEFLRVYWSLKMQFDTALELEKCGEATGGVPNTTSVLIKDIERLVGTSSECCICFERQHEILLPCLHSFCQACINSWNVSHHTCPICRGKIGSDQDSWVIFDAPSNLEIEEELVSSMMDIVTSKPDDRLSPQ